MMVQRGPSEETTKQPGRAAALSQPTVAMLVFLAAATRTRVISADLALPRREHNVDTLPSEIRKDKSRSSCFCGFPAQYSIAPCSRERRQCSGRRRVINCWLLEVAKHISRNCQHRTRGKSGPPWRGARKKPAGQGRRAGQLFAAMAHR